MALINFQARFADAILHGTKYHTVRQRRSKGRASVGKPLHLYTGLRTSSARKLLETACLYVMPIDLFCTVELLGPETLLPMRRRVLEVRIQGRYLTEEEVEVFARQDGFANSNEMYEWLERTHAGELVGADLIGWRPTHYAKPEMRLLIQEGGEYGAIR